MTSGPPVMTALSGHQSHNTSWPTNHENAHLTLLLESHPNRKIEQSIFLKFDNDIGLAIFPLIFGKICHLTLMMLGANFGQYKIMQKTWKIIESLLHVYSFEITLWEPSNQ